MAVPHALYVRFLATKGHLDLPKMNAELSELGLPSIKQDDLDVQTDLLYRTLPAPLMNKIENGKTGDDFLKWMRVLEVQEAWEAEKAFVVPETRRMFTVVTGVLDDPQLRIAINALLIKAVKPRDMVEVLNLRYSAMLKEEHIALYQKYYFDPRRMTRKDWKTFLKPLEGKDSQTLRIYFTALTESEDSLRTELGLPAQVNTSENLQFLLQKSMSKAKNYLSQHTKEANVEARAWIAQVLALTDKYEKFKTGDKADFGKQLQMQFDFVETEFPMPDAETMHELFPEETKKLNPA